MVVGKGPLPGEINEHHRQQGSDQVPKVDDDPVAHDLPKSQFAADPGHDDQVVARKELGASDDDQNKTQTEDQATQKSIHPKAQPAVGDHERGKLGPQSNKGSCQDGQSEHAPEIQMNLLDADILHPFRHLGRRNGIKCNLV